MNVHESPSIIERVEEKYPLPRDAMAEMRQRVEKYLPVFRFDGVNDLWRIRTTYLDTPDLRSYREYRESRTLRSKVRIRQYGLEEKFGEMCWVELKVKRDCRSHKRRFMCRVQDVPDLLAGRDILSRVLAVSGNLAHVAEAYQVVRDRIISLALKPVLRVDYLRVAFQEEGDTQHRLTLDCNIRSYARGEESSDFDSMLMEIKYRDQCPGWLPALLEACGDLQPDGFSKYARAVRHHGLHKEAKQD